MASRGSYEAPRCPPTAGVSSRQPYVWALLCCSLLLHRSAHSKEIAVAKDRDESWTLLETPYGRLTDVTIHNGRAYALSDDGRAVVCDLAGAPSTVTCVVPQGFERGTVLRQDAVETDYLYLVAPPSGRDLLLAMRRSWNTKFWDDTCRYMTKGMEVFELDVGGGRWRKVESLRGSALFVGDKFSSFSVEGPMEFMGNRVYVSDEGREHSVGVFDMEDGRVELCHLDCEGMNWWEWSPIWFTPSLL